MEIDWKEPPPITGRRGNGEVYAHLATRPGHHAVIGTYDSRSSADNRLTQIRSGKVQAANRVGRFDGRVVKNEDGKWELFVRCVVVK